MIGAGGVIGDSLTRRRAFAMDMVAWRVNRGHSIYRAAQLIGGLLSSDIEAVEKGLHDPIEMPPELFARIQRATGPLATLDPLMTEIPAEREGHATAWPPPAIPMAAGGDVTTYAGIAAVTAALVDGHPGRVTLNIGGGDHLRLGDGNLYLHPDFADQLAIDLIRLAVTARASLATEGADHGDVRTD